MDMQNVRLRNLAKSKAYRDAIATRDESERPRRKRVIIAASLTSASERDSHLTDFNNAISRSRRVKFGPIKPTHQPIQSSIESEDAKLSGYRNWIEQRKILRKDLDQCGNVANWLENKPSLTEVEQHVHQLCAMPIREKLKAKKPLKHKEDEDGSNDIHGRSDSKYPPSIQQPLPVILANINKYLAKKRLRMYDLFVQADRDKDWQITRKEFQDVMKRTGIPIKDSEIEQLVSALDENNNDVLEYKELVHGRDLFIINQRAKRHSENNIPALVHDAADSLETDLHDTETKQSELARRSSSQSLLSLPDVSSSELLPLKDKEKLLKRQKRKEKHRNKTKVTDKGDRQLCTMGGVTGLMADTYQKQKQKEYETIVELCHLHGVQLSRNLLKKVLVHPEDRSLDVCVSSLKHPSRYLLSEQELFQRLAPATSDPRGKRFSKRIQSSFYTYYVYPPADSVALKSERMSLPSGSAIISRKTDCWMTYEEYNSLTRHLDSRFEKTWGPSDENAYWPSYVFDKLRLYLDRPRTQVRSENSIFDVVHNNTMH